MENLMPPIQDVLITGNLIKIYDILYTVQGSNKIFLTRHNIKMSIKRNKKYRESKEPKIISLRYANLADLSCGGCRVSPIDEDWQQKVKRKVKSTVIL